MIGATWYGRVGRSLFLFLTLCVLLAVIPSLKAEASFQLFIDEFDDDLAVWTIQGGWQAQEGALVSAGASSLGWMGRYDWRNYVIDARIKIQALQEDGVLRLLGRRQKNGDAFALELTQHEMRLVTLEGNESRVLARSPITWRADKEHLVRLGLFENTLIGQFNNENPLTVSLDSTAVGGRTAGQVGLFATGATLSIDVFQVVSIESANLPRSSIGPDPGYLPPGTERNAGARDIMLIYSGYYASRAGEWDLADAMPYLAYVQYANGKAEFKDWFFDTFLFLGLQAPSGRAFDSPGRAAPANMEDWQWYLNTLFQERKQLGAFNVALETLKSRLNEPDYRAKVIIMIPHAIPSQRNFGDVDGDGKSESFSPAEQGVALAEASRWKAVKWYVDQVERKWQEAGYANLELVGYYWLDEHLGANGGLTPDVLIRRTTDYIHTMDRKLYWIPYFHAARYEKAYESGFDSVIMQPNYMFDTRISRARFESLAQTAKREYFGVEIEADGTVLTTVAGRERYLDYLRAGVTYGYMKDAVHAYYQDAKVFLQASYSWNPAVRAIYDATYAFVKGTFNEPLPKEE